MTTPTAHDTARRHVVRAASRHPHVLYAQPAIAGATALLDEWLTAAARRGVVATFRPELAVQLAGIGLEAITADYRARIPDETGAVVLLEAAAAILRSRGIDSTRDGFGVPVRRTLSSPAWGPTGTARLVITCSDAGWGLALDLPSSLVVDVEAGHDAEGAAAVVDVALAVVRGEYGNPFRLA
jgi:hypothetical protein